MGRNVVVRNICNQRLLITMPWGIGDAVDVGLSAVDQIAQNDPDGTVAIDILCNNVQAPLFEHDPRIRAIITFDAHLFPTPARGSWKRGVFLSLEVRKLVAYLRQRHYKGVLPILFGPSFFGLLRILGTQVLFLNIGESWKTIRKLHKLQDISMQQVVRHIINKHFGNKAPEPGADEPIPLYLCPESLHHARQYMAQRKRQAGLDQDHSPWLLVAPDTSSVVTRPPTSLLAQGIAGALQANPRLYVDILPSYTDTQAGDRLWHALAPRFPERIFRMPAEPKLSLPELAALIDQGDIFLTGDTGVMHLAAAIKTLPHGGCSKILPRNTVKIIALFGGTHPCLHGYSKRTLILGKGRKEQKALTPGIIKDMYRDKGKDLFDHISPHEITKALLD